MFLDLHDNLLQSLPEEIGMLENLTRINLNHNKLKELPVEFFRLKNLKSLTVSNNELEQLHEDVGQLAYLETLDLAYNKLGSLPPSLGYCSNLKKLDCNNNKLRGVPNDLSSLHKLTTLDLSDNGLEVWPETFNAFSKLETLYLKNNKLMLMPGLRECPHLKEIHLGYNRLQKLTVDDIENLPNIHLLDLRDNRINAIPDEIVNLQTLERLDLSSNDLSNLPFAIGTMPNIKTLSIEGNPMKSIRRDILKRGTVELMKYLRSRMSDEELAKMREIGNVSPVANICDSPPVPDKYAMKTNATMNMSKKDINTLPDEAVENAQEAKVKAVDLSRNQFTELPNNMEPILPRLFELNMSFNRLEKIAPFIGLAQSLAYLNVGNNRLSDLPAELSQIPHLRELAIPFNQFSKIPEVVFSCLKLETLVMCDNKLTEIPVEGLAKLERLAILDLSNNNINSVPGELGLMRQLQGLQLEGNAFRVPRRDLLLKGTEAVLKYLRDKIPANKQ